MRTPTDIVSGLAAMSDTLLVSLADVLSAASACVAESSTFPFDMLKTRLMIQGETAASAGKSTPSKGLVSMARTMLREEVQILAQLYHFLSAH